MSNPTTRPAATWLPKRWVYESGNLATFFLSFFLSVAYTKSLFRLRAQSIQMTGHPKATQFTESEFWLTVPAILLTSANRPGFDFFVRGFYREPSWMLVTVTTLNLFSTNNWRQAKNTRALKRCLRWAKHSCTNLTCVIWSICHKKQSVKILRPKFGK